MILFFTNQEKYGYRWMRVLAIPSYALALLLSFIVPFWQPLSGLAVFVLTGLVYSFAYCKALEWYVRRPGPKVAWRFAGAVLLVQTLVLMATLYGVAA